MDPWSPVQFQPCFLVVSDATNTSLLQLGSDITAGSKTEGIHQPEGGRPLGHSMDGPDGRLRWKLKQHALKTHEYCIKSDVFCQSGRPYPHLVSTPHLQFWRDCQESLNHWNWPWNESLRWSNLDSEPQRGEVVHLRLAQRAVAYMMLELRFLDSQSATFLFSLL